MAAGLTGRLLLGATSSWTLVRRLASDVDATHRTGSTIVAATIAIGITPVR